MPHGYPIPFGRAGRLACAPAVLQVSFAGLDMNRYPSLPDSCDLLIVFHEACEWPLPAETNTTGAWIRRMECARRHGTYLFSVGSRVL
jgi:hypothetical protein